MLADEYVKIDPPNYAGVLDLLFTVLTRFVLLISLSVGSRIHSESSRVLFLSLSFGRHSMTSRFFFLHRVSFFFLLLGQINVEGKREREVEL